MIQSEKALTVTRLFKAPIGLVWEVWTNPDHIIQWWGPNGFTNTIKKMEFKPGGVFEYTMHGPDGVDYPNKITYKIITPPNRLEFSLGSDDDNDPGNFEVVVVFNSIGKQTEITMTMTFQSKEAKDEVVEKYGAIEGNKQTLDKLELYLAKFEKNESITKG